MNFTALQDKPECLGSPQVVVAGESLSPTITYWGTVTTSGGTEVAYRGVTDMSSTVLSGSLSSVANVLTCKAISAEVGGYTYRYFVTIIVGGETIVRYFDRQVLLKGSPNSSFR